MVADNPDLGTSRPPNLRVSGAEKSDGGCAAGSCQVSDSRIITNEESGFAHERSQFAEGPVY